VKYIVKVGDRHVIECNGTNYEVEEKDDSFRCEGITVYKDGLRISTYAKSHLTTIVLVLQIAQLIMEQKEKESNND